MCVLMTYFLSPCNIIYNFNEMLLHIKTYFFLELFVLKQLLRFFPKHIIFKLFLQLTGEACYTLFSKYIHKYYHYLMNSLFPCCPT